MAHGLETSSKKSFSFVEINMAIPVSPLNRPAVTENPPTEPRSASNLRKDFDRFILGSLVAAHIITFAPYLTALNSNIIRVAQAYYLFVIGGYVLMSIVLMRRIFTTFSFFGIIILLVIQQRAFADRYQISPNYNSIIAYCAIGVYIVFVQLKLTLREKLDVILYVSLVYAVLYCLLYNYFSGLGESADAGVIHSAERGTRLLAALLYLCSGVAIVWGRIMLGSRNGIILLRNIAILIPFVAALILANSRAITAILALSLMLMTFVRIGGLSRVLAFLVPIGAMGLLLCVPLNINPYSNTEDSSARARFLVFDIARDILMDDPLFGRGISSSEDFTVERVGDPGSETRFHRKVALFPSDLSYIGMWLQFGLFGSIAALLALPLSINGRLDPTADPASIFAARVLGFAIPLYAPSFIGGSATVIFALLIAEHITSRREVPIRV